MADLRPEKEWWTAAELAAAGLPDMPGTRQNVEALAKREGWRGTAFSRPRQGRGGGWEYSWQLLPIRARRQLLADAKALPAVAPKASPERDAAWEWFEGLPARIRAVAEERLALLLKVEALVAQVGVTKVAAVALVANEAGLCDRSLFGWFAQLRGVARADYLPHLAPRNRAAPKRGPKVEIDARFMELIKGDYLRPAGPTLSSCYRRVKAVAAKAGVPVPPEHLVRRRLKAEVSEFTLTLYRKGEDALKAMYPPQKRARWELRPLEVVVADFHRWDVFVEWPAQGNQPPVIGRPQMVAFQDVATNKILSFRFDQTPNSTAVALAAGDMIEAFGIPEHVLFDNGREFAAKSLTGGVATRYRFKVREDDVPGLFVQLGCEIHWATPYSGQSKPIERAFRDHCNDIAKDPRFDGAYTGNNPMAKPEDYGTRAIPLADFIRVVEEGIAEYNARPDRRSEVAFGRSYDEVFAERYAETPIRRATEAQRRLWLMGQEVLRANAKTGLLVFQGNEYWAEWLHSVAGDEIVARFDPEDYFDGLHVYSREGEYLGHAPLKKAAGFLNAEEGRLHARAKRDWLKRAKALATAERRLTAIEIGEALDALPPSNPAQAPETRVVRPVFGGPKAKRGGDTPEPARTADQEAIHAAVVADLTSRLPQPVAEETAREKFRRALELEEQLKAGADLTADQRRWLHSYQQTSEYRGELAVFQRFGPSMFAG